MNIYRHLSLLLLFLVMYSFSCFSDEKKSEQYGKNEEQHIEWVKPKYKVLFKFKWGEKKGEIGNNGKYFPYGIQVANKQVYVNTVMPKICILSMVGQLINEVPTEDYEISHFSVLSDETIVGGGVYKIQKIIEDPKKGKLRVAEKQPKCIIVHNTKNGDTWKKLTVPEGLASSYPLVLSQMGIKTLRGEITFDLKENKINKVEKGILQQSHPHAKWTKHGYKQNLVFVNHEAKEMDRFTLVTRLGKYQYAINELRPLRSPKGSYYYEAIIWTDKIELEACRGVLVYNPDTHSCSLIADFDQTYRNMTTQVIDIDENNNAYQFAIGENGQAEIRQLTLGVVE